jgi:hypothetical protein
MKQTQLAAGLLTEPEVAKLLQVEPRTVRCWRTHRGLPYLKLTAKIVRFRGEDVLAWAGRFHTEVVSPRPHTFKRTTRNPEAN